MSDSRYFSYSQLDMLTRCGQQWYYRYEEGLKIPPASRMLVGRAVDHSVNADMREKIDSGELLPDDAIQDIARDGLEREWQKTGVELEEDEKELGVRKVKGLAIDRSVTLAGHHHGAIAPSVEPEHVQRRFDIDIEGYDVTLVGYLDIDEGQKAVRDTKTTRKSPSPADMEQSTQVTTYALAKQVLDGGAPDAVKLDYLIDRSANKTDKTPKHKTFVSTRGPDDFQPLLNRIERALEVIESGIIMPAPAGAWWCSRNWCGYFNICPWVNHNPKSVTVEELPAKSLGEQLVESVEEGEKDV
jgi:hypothetical protein